MIDNPDSFLKAFRDASADMISVHPEVCLHLNRTLETIRNLGAKASVALNPATPLYEIDHVWDYIDMILIMTVNPGFGGQKFIRESTNKILKLKKKSERINPNIDIEVDGGINLENIQEVRKAGANVFVAGHAVFKSNNYSQTIEKMKKLTL